MKQALGSSVHTERGPGAPEVTASGQACGGSCTPTSDRGGDRGIVGKCLMLAGPGGGAETSEGWRGTWGRHPGEIPGLVAGAGTPAQVNVVCNYYMVTVKMGASFSL